MLKSTLYKIKKDGCKSSFILGVAHNSYTLTPKVIKALTKSTSLLVESLQENRTLVPGSSEHALIEISKAMHKSIIWLDMHSQRDTLKTLQTISTLKNNMLRKFPSLRYDMNHLENMAAQLSPVATPQDLLDFSNSQKLFELSLVGTPYISFLNKFDRERESLWAPLIISTTEIGGAFICCGISHVRSIINFLRSYDYNVNPITL